MNGKVAKRLRKQASALKVGQPMGVWKRVYKILKYNYNIVKRFPHLKKEYEVIFFTETSS